MKGELVERLKMNMEEISHTVDEKTALKLELDKSKRIVKRLSSFSNDCEACEHHLLELDSQFIEVLERIDQLDKKDFKEHYTMTENITSHLQEQHKLIPEGHYMSIYMSIGVSIGLLFGLFVFDNIAIGLPIGMVIGMMIGIGIDKDTKKNGRTI